MVVVVVVAVVVGAAAASERAVRDFVVVAVVRCVRGRRSSVVGRAGVGEDCAGYSLLL